MSEIVLLVEGKTEKAIRESLRAFLDIRCSEAERPRVGLRSKEMSSNLLNEKKLRDQVANNLENPDVLGVIALIDVVCSGRSFSNAEEAIRFLRERAPNDPRFRAHAAQFDFEAWLLPYWKEICARLGIQRRPFGPNPETVNSQNPPSRRLQQLYREHERVYVKTLEARVILKGKDLTISANRCPQFKSFLNSLLELAGCRPLP
ncbi:MAG: DUF4276 family protein [Candidatus Sumerlaeota bacterium]|nr:DUF4276 family protein [Candidatus Sumerlaeota bacterium]